MSILKLHKQVEIYLLALFVILSFSSYISCKDDVFEDVPLTRNTNDGATADHTIRWEENCVYSCGISQCFCHGCNPGRCTLDSFDLRKFPKFLQVAPMMVWSAFSGVSQIVASCLFPNPLFSCLVPHCSATAQLTCLSVTNGGCCLCFCGGCLVYGCIHHSGKPFLLRKYEEGQGYFWHKFSDDRFG